MADALIPSICFLSQKLIIAYLLIRIAIAYRQSDTKTLWNQIQIIRSDQRSKTASFQIGSRNGKHMMRQKDEDYLYIYCLFEVLCWDKMFSSKLFYSKSNWKSIALFFVCRLGIYSNCWNFHHSMLNKFTTAHNQFGPFELNVIAWPNCRLALKQRGGEPVRKKREQEQRIHFGDRCNDQIGGELQSMVHIFTAPSIQMDKSYQLRGPHSRFKRLNPKNGAVSFLTIESMLRWALNRYLSMHYQFC